MPRRSRRSTSRTLLRLGLALVLLVIGYLVRPHQRQRPTTVPRPTQPLSPGELHITFVDVGQGDAILIQLGETDILVDTGPHDACRHLSDVLQQARGDIELLLLTHPHDDHYGCAANVLQRHEVKRLITNGERRGPPRDREPQLSWDRFEEAARRDRLKTESLRVGDELMPAPGLVLKVLATGSSEGGSFPDTALGEDINNDSLVFMLEYAGRRVLFTGDIEEAEGKQLVKRFCSVLSWSCPALEADVLKVPHHGSEHFAPELFDAVQPSWAVISADYANRKHHLPRAKTVQALEDDGAYVLSTSAAGTEDVELRITPQGELLWQSPQEPVFAWEGSQPRRYRQ